MKRLFTRLAALLLIAALALAPATVFATELPFTDVQEGDWFYPYVKELYADGTINGMTATTFVPNGNLTYGQALKLIVCALGYGEQKASPTHWASGYVKFARGKGWFTGNVDPDGEVTRLAFCQIAAKAKELHSQPAENPFKDTSDTSVLALVDAGVINGMSADTFAPDGVLTRAQISKIICTLRTAVDREEEENITKNHTPPEHPLPTEAELKQRGETYYVGASRKDKSLVSLLLDLTGNEKQKTIFIDAGEYDLFAEYMAEVKAGRIAVPADTIGNGTYMEVSGTDKWYNAFVPNNTTIYGLGDVTLRFTPAVNEITYGASIVWSPLNIFGSVELYNLNVLVKNCRYALHNDDHNRYPGSTQYYYNCRFEKQFGDTNADGKRLGANSTIGFGINDESVHYFDHCEMYFDGDGNNGVFYGHDASKGNKSAWIYLKDCHIYASDPKNARVIRLQTLSKNVRDRPVYVTVQNCEVNGGLQFNMYYAESIQTFSVVYRGTPAQPISRSNNEGSVNDPYTVKYYP